MSDNVDYQDTMTHAERMNLHTNFYVTGEKVGGMVSQIWGYA